MVTAVAGRVASLAALPLLFLSGVAGAANFKVAPVRINLEPTQRSEVVTLTNGGVDEVSVQADALAWSQNEDGADVYTDTGDLLIVPRIFTLAPGATQVVRVGRMVTADAAREGAYRVFFTELAPPADAGPQPGLRFRLRLGIPVFTRPEAPTPPKLELVRGEPSDTGFELVLANNGASHVQLLTFRSDRRVGRGAHDLELPLGDYLLPGTTRRFVLPVPPDIRIDTFAVETDVAGTIEYVARPRN
jgi:fimbrial chaperone protein